MVTQAVMTDTRDQHATISPWRPLPAEFARSAGLLRRPEHQRPRAQPLDDIVAWLLGPARDAPSALEMFDEFSWRLVAAGLPVMRTTLHAGTLHPQFLGFSIRWLRDPGEAEELMIFHEMRSASAFVASPIRLAIEEGAATRRRLEGPDAVLDFPVLPELREQGATDYLVQPLRGSRGRRFAATYCTDQRGGFSEQHVAGLLRLADPLSLVVDLFSHRSVARNLLNAYLGSQAGPKVLDGQIQRGGGEEMRAVVWLSDLRGFTTRSDRLAGDRIVAMLNGCFDAQAAAVARHGGEILKFMGDGLLAIFPIEDAGFAGQAARNALEAAQEAQAALAHVTESACMAEEPPWRMVVALHVGAVHYGNIGAAERLDFTVIGPAVNLASRVESVAKALDRPIVVTEAFRNAYGRDLVSLGHHVLRGLPGLYEMFAPDVVGAAVPVT
jgi:adenylate cyclase